MSNSSALPPRRTGSLYGALAYATVILACYSGFFARQYYFTSEWMVPVVFALGIVYVAFGVLGGGLVECGGQAGSAAYYLLQCGVLTAIVFLSPIRGFIGIIVLPLVSQAIFDLRTRYAVLIGVYLFVVNLAVWVGPRRWGAVSEAAVDYSAAFVFTIAFTIITKQATDARRSEEELRQKVEAANQLLREQAAQAEDLATTRERNRLAREIHDGLGHYLTVVKTQLDAATGLIASQPDKAREAVAKAAKLTGDALDDVRRSVGSLRADVTRPPLSEALRALTEEAGMPVTIRIEGAARPLPSGVEHALFRSVQEGLTNIRKHAAASAAEVALDFRPAGRVTLAVTDDGQGAGDALRAGVGLRGIRERIELLGGHVESGNRPGGGFAVTIEVPA